MNDIYDVVIKLTGPIKPVGETYADNERYENLKVMCSLVEKLLFDIDAVIPNKDSHDYNVKRAGEYAGKFFDKIGIKE